MGHFVFKIEWALESDHYTNRLGERGSIVSRTITRKSPQLNPWELRWNNLLVLDLLHYHASKYFVSKDFFTLMLSGFEMIQP